VPTPERPLLALVARPQWALLAGRQALRTSVTDSRWDRTTSERVAAWRGEGVGPSSSVAQAQDRASSIEEIGSPP
jgi:hypothetical protein